MKNRLQFKHQKVGSKRSYVIITYTTLLVISQIIRLVFPWQPQPEQNQKVITIDPPADHNPIRSQIELAYAEQSRDPDSDSPTILLIHGNPPSADRAFRNLIPDLAHSGRVIAPDLPGFGASLRKIDDYGAATQAEILLLLLDRLEVSSVHLVAFGMGGSVAVNMSHLAPERIRSVAMISAVGVQEFELLGDPIINRAVYGFQLALVWLVHNALPHMGLLDGLPWNLPYARTFFDTDLRPLRAYLTRYDQPMLIVHGKQNARVPAAAAREHYRIVPQSELVLLDSGHRIISEHLPQIAAQITDFIGRVENGRATTRPTANSDRRLQAQKALDDVAVPPADGLALVIIMIVIVLATLISEDLTCIGAGLMAARGIIGFVPALAAAFVGILFGDILLYLAGRFVGRPALRYPPFKWMIKEEDIRRTSRWFVAKGPVIVFVSRFLPGSRFPTYFSAGIFDTGFWKFVFYFTIGSILWTPMLVGLATVVGNSLFGYFDLIKRYGMPVLAAAVLFLWAAVKLIVPLFSYRGRRLLLSAFRRATRWEFWPPYIFYIPVLGYAAFLMLRYRSMTVFTAANPGISEGGFIGESKSRILDHLSQERDRIASYHLIRATLEPDQRIAHAVDFMSSHGCGFPVVLKPDVGQRGSGVVIARSSQQLEQTLRRTTVDTIIQAYIAGNEYGVFYYRYPDEPRGHIYSITDKRLLKLTGDGVSTLEQLILNDDRAVCMAKYHLKQHGERLYEIPAQGEQIRLVQVGTHCRGALFLDGNALRSAALESAIDKISRGFKGFYFGRYDIRVPSPSDLKRGENFKIIELNGVTSEATHIYQPGNSLWSAYGVLMRQWKMAFDIGRSNARRGTHPASAGRLFNLLFSYRRAGST